MTIKDYTGTIQTFLAGLEVAEKFGVGWVVAGFQVATVSNSNASCFRVALS